MTHASTTNFLSAHLGHPLVDKNNSSWALEAYQRYFLSLDRDVGSAEVTQGYDRSDAGGIDNISIMI